jgi:hypothetical protein
MALEMPVPPITSPESKEESYSRFKYWFSLFLTKLIADAWHHPTKPVEAQTAATSRMSWRFSAGEIE